ncbi:hypothetical protein AA0N74_07820 [Chromobacterium vaccinii]|uniref:hypothetical protein n=1 Tax=Chromobacterium vaccinii TaxID=1108595 RepID=UPI0031CE6362
MLIECKQKREGGTVVILGDVLYRFLPDVQGRHVAEVENDDHVADFLAVKEGYALAKELPKAEAKAKTSKELPKIEAEDKTGDEQPKAEDKPGDDPAKPARGSRSKKSAGEGEDKNSGSDDASKNGEQG